MKTLFSATALSLLAGAAVAGPVGEARDKTNEAAGKVVAVTGALNGQVNLGEVTSRLNVVTEKTGDTTATAAAIGNSLSATVTAVDVGALGLAALQVNGGDVVASLNGRITDVSGEVSATSAAIGNSASLSVDSATGAIGAAIGQGNGGAVTAVADVAVRDASRAVNVTSAAIGNSISIVNGAVE